MKKILKKLLFISLLFSAVMPFEAQAIVFSWNIWKHRVIKVSTKTVNLLYKIGMKPFIFLTNDSFGGIIARGCFCYFFAWKCLSGRPFHIGVQGKIAAFISCSSLVHKFLLPGINGLISKRKKSFFDALESQNLVKTKRALRLGYDVNEINLFSEEGLTGVVIAAHNNQLKMIELLVAYGADLNRRFSKKKTTLMLVAEKSNQETVEFFLNNGADINSKASDGKTALQYAVKGGNGEVITLLKEARKKEIFETLTEIVSEEEFEKEFQGLDRENALSIIMGYSSDLLLAEAEES